MKDLQGKVAVITGAGSGIGRTLAIRLHQEKVVLALADIDRKGLQETERLLQQKTTGASVEIYPLDVANREQVYEFAKNAADTFGRIDILINNAGVSSSGTVPELTYPTLEWTININLWGVIYCTKAFLPYLSQSAEAGIVNLSSVYGLLGIPGQAAYCASKFAVRGFSESLRQELNGSHICVTVVFPGGVKTNIAKNSRSDYRVSPDLYQKALRQFEESLQTTPDEAAKLIIDGIKNKSPRVLIGKDARKIDLLARWRPDSYDKVIARHIAKQNR
jgi:Short-chain dehydrogenases of various substrate specificities